MLISMREILLRPEVMATLATMTIADIERYVSALPGAHAQLKHVNPDGYRLPGIAGAVFYDPSDLS
jgi:hypothetical protein